MFDAPCRALGNDLVHSRYSLGHLPFRIYSVPFLLFKRQRIVSRQTLIATKKRLWICIRRAYANYVRYTRLGSLIKRGKTSFT